MCKKKNRARRKLAVGTNCSHLQCESWICGTGIYPPHGGPVFKYNLYTSLRPGYVPITVQLCRNAYNRIIRDHYWIAVNKILP